MANSVAVATDSVACLPRELVQKYGISIIPLIVVLEGRAHRDGVDITPGEVYQALKKEATRLPTTSAPSPGQVVEVYQDLGRWAKGILCVTVSSKLSMMFNAAHQAKEMVRERLPETEIMVLDSRTAAGAQGFMAVAAAQAAASGEKDLARVALRAQELAPRVHLIATFDTLHYLVKGGRIGKAAGWASSVLNIKPIVHVVDGEIAPLERPRSRAMALSRLVEVMQHRVGEKVVHVNLHHAAVPEEAEALKSTIQSKFNCVEFYVTDFTPVMGVHTGPGTIALSFYAED